MINFTLGCVDTSELHEIRPIQNEQFNKTISTTIPIGHTEENIFVSTLQVAWLEGSLNLGDTSIVDPHNKISIIPRIL